MGRKNKSKKKEKYGSINVANESKKSGQSISSASEIKTDENKFTKDRDSFFSQNAIDEKDVIGINTSFNDIQTACDHAKNAAKEKSVDKEMVSPTDDIQTACYHAKNTAKEKSDDKDMVSPPDDIRTACYHAKNAVNEKSDDKDIFYSTDDIVTTCLKNWTNENKGERNICISDKSIQLSYQSPRILESDLIDKDMRDLFRSCLFLHGFVKGMRKSFSNKDDVIPYQTRRRYKVPQSKSSEPNLLSKGSINCHLNQNVAHNNPDFAKYFLRPVTESEINAETDDAIKYSMDHNYFNEETTTSSYVELDTKGGTGSILDVQMDENFQQNKKKNRKIRNKGKNNGNRSTGDIQTVSRSFQILTEGKEEIQGKNNKRCTPSEFRSLNTKLSINKDSSIVNDKCMRKDDIHKRKMSTNMEKNIYSEKPSSRRESSEGFRHMNFQLSKFDSEITKCQGLKSELKILEEPLEEETLTNINQTNYGYIVKPKSEDEVTTQPDVEVTVKPDIEVTTQPDDGVTTQSDSEGTTQLEEDEIIRLESEVTEREDKVGQKLTMEPEGEAIKTVEIPSKQGEAIMQLGKDISFMFDTNGKQYINTGGLYLLVEQDTIYDFKDVNVQVSFIGSQIFVSTLSSKFDILIQKPQLVDFEDKATQTVI